MVNFDSFPDVFEKLTVSAFDCFAKPIGYVKHYVTRPMLNGIGGVLQKKLRLLWTSFPVKKEKPTLNYPLNMTANARVSVAKAVSLVCAPALARHKF